MCRLRAQWLQEGVCGDVQSVARAERRGGAAAYLPPSRASPKPPAPSPRPGRRQPTPAHLHMAMARDEMNVT